MREIRTRVMLIVWSGFMSPIAALLLRAMRTSLVVLAALVALFMGFEAWKTLTAPGPAVFNRQTIVFWLVLAGLLVACLWLARSVQGEINRDTPPGPGTGQP